MKKVKKVKALIRMKKRDQESSTSQQLLRQIKVQLALMTIKSSTKIHLQMPKSHLRDKT